MQILEMTYTNTIRETEGGTYGVGIGGDLERIESGETTLYMRFDTDPEKVNHLAPMIQSEFLKIVESGVNEVYFNKAKEHLLKQYDQEIKQNSTWSNVITRTVFYQDNSFSTTHSDIMNMTKEDVQTLAKEILEQGNLIEIIMNPLEK